MTVYVDNMLRRAQVGQGRPANWSHLMADSTEELREFAQRLGLRMEWIQHEGTRREHFDVTATVREKALRLGATPITYPRGVADLFASDSYRGGPPRLDQATLDAIVARATAGTP